jgi:hypothetical protein
VEHGLGKLKAVSQLTPAVEPLPEAAPARPRGDLGRLVRWTGEFLSVAAALSFLLSVWANQLVFERWGLSFLQLATLADVVTSGLNLLFWGLIPLTGLFLLAYAVGRLGPRARWLKRGVAALGLLLGLLGVAVVALGQSAVFALLGGVTLLAVLLPGALHARRHPSRGGRVRQAAVAGLLCLTTAALVHSIVQSYEEAGYGGSRPLHLETALPGCIGHVMWSGERALVLSCKEVRDDRPPDDVMVVYEPQGLTVRRMAREKPLRPARPPQEASPRPSIR